MFSTTQHLGVTVLGSGSKGNSTLVHCGKEAILVDAGFSLRDFRRRLAEAALPDDLCLQGILVTHEHTDHVRGLAKIADAFGAPVFTTTRCAAAINAVAKTPIPCNRIEAGSTFRIRDFTIRSFSIPHDAADPVGYTVSRDCGKAGIATDFGICTISIIDALKGCGALVIESNHDLKLLEGSNRPIQLKYRIKGTFGHLSNGAACDVIERLAPQGLRQLILAHLSEECNTPQLAHDTAAACLQRLHRSDVGLAVAQQTAPLHTVWL